VVRLVNPGKDAHDAAFDRFFDAAPFPSQDTPYGSGSFGRWTLDPRARPAYEYAMNQSADPRASYFVTGGASRDHWHLLGDRAQRRIRPDLRWDARRQVPQSLGSPARPLQRRL
jgi:hypothetical protein